MNAIRHLLIKEFKQIFRTKEMVAIIFGMPLIQLIVLGFAITNEVKNIDRETSRVVQKLDRNKLKIKGYG